MVDGHQSIKVEDLLSDLSRMSDIIAKVPLSMTQELGEVSFEFFTKHCKLEPFLSWTMKREVLGTSKKLICMNLQNIMESFLERKHLEQQCLKEQ